MKNVAASATLTGRQGGGCGVRLPGAVLQGRAGAAQVGCENVDSSRSRS